jgi:deoxyadenosine/deoxycytidine kinase
MMAYISRLKILRDIVKEVTSKNDNEKYIIITERSLYTDKHVFAKMLYDQCKIENVCYEIYLTWFDEFAKDFPINYSVYVNTDPTKCYNRIHKRARDGEEVIPLDYLNDCHKYHEEFLNASNTIKHKLILDGNVDIYKNETIMNKWLERIDLFIF